MTVLDLTVLDLVLLAVAALLVGFAKTALAGVGAISVAVFAAVLPARASTGALLPLLIVGDVIAVAVYRRDADWGVLLRLLPAVVVGVLVGVAFVGRVDDVVMRRTIGVVLVLLVAVHLLDARRRRPPPAGAEPGDRQPRDRQPADQPGPAAGGSRLRTGGSGVLAGFTTMVANAGGPVTSLYLLSTGLPVLGFLGTTAWFFFVLNLFKLPFSIGLGLVDLGSLRLCLLLSPVVLVGALVGRAVVARISRERFEVVVLVLTVGAGLNLLR